MDLIIFDLDGTLVDSEKDIVCAVNAMRAQMGFAPMDHETVRGYVGHGAPVLVRRVLGQAATDAEAAEGLRLFQAYYKAHPYDFTRPYPGVMDTLLALDAQGIPMAVLTNKPAGISESILDGLTMLRFFFRVIGGDSLAQKKPDPVGVRELMAACGAKSERTLMVGDSAVDMQTARNAGIRVVGVTYGFQPEALAAEGADWLVDDLGRLLAILESV